MLSTDVFAMLLPVRRALQQQNAFGMVVLRIKDGPHSSTAGDSSWQEVERFQPAVLKDAECNMELLACTSDQAGATGRPPLMSTANAESMYCVSSLSST